MDAAEQKRPLTLRNGKQFTLHELSFGDILDLEESGYPQHEWQALLNDKAKKFRFLGELLWVLVRRTGATAEQVEKRTWPIARTSFLYDLSLLDIEPTMQQVMPYLTPFAQPATPTG